MDPQPPSPTSFNSSAEKFPHRSQPSSPQSDAMPHQDFQTRSSFDSELAAIDDLPLAPSDSPIQTLAGGQSSIPIEPEPISAVDGESSSLVPSLKQGLNGANLSCARVEEKEAQREEDSPASPSYCVEGGLSNYDPNPHWSPFAENSYYIQEERLSMVGAGLINLGNTCFINAVLQCFTHTVPLVKGLRSCKHDMLCRGECEEFCVICSMYDHIQLSIESSGGCISPLKFVDNLNHFSTSFMRYQQEDAHEFLQCFLDKLERCFLNLKKEENSLTPPIENLVQKVFGGRLISRLQCCNCGHCSDTFEPLIDLSLEIENVDSLPSALQSFTSEEKIGDSDTKFTCENCKEEVEVVKQLMVDQAPSVAVFHLKRFKNDGSYVEKIDKHVKFPLELELQSYTTSESSDDVELIYDLYAIVVHVGLSSMFGHYFSFVRSSPGIWHRLDDSKVTRVEEEFVLSQDAYILFYARRGTPWFSSLIGAEMKSLDSANLSTSPQSVLDAVENTCPLPISTYIDDASVAPDAVSCSPKLSCLNQNFITTPIGKVESGEAKASSANCIATPTSEVKASDLNCNATPIRENDCQGVESIEVKIDGYDGFHPLTPPRSQSPELFSFETPVSSASSFQIPRGHLKSEERATTRKRLPNKVPDDSKTKEAIRYLSKSMPSSRGSKLLDAMCGPQSAGASRKKKRMVSPCKRAGHANARHKSSHGSVVHPVAAVLR